MANIITSKTRSYFQTKPPLGAQLNFSHPLSRGLVGAWMMNEGGGLKVEDLARNNDGVISGASWKTGIKGSLLTFSSTNVITLGTNDILVPCVVGNSPPQSIVSWVYPTSGGGGNFGRIINREPNNFYQDNLTVTNGLIWNLGSGTSVFARTNSNAFILNTWQQVVGTWTGSTTSPPKIYVNALEQTYQATGTGNPSASNSGVITRIGNSSAGTRNFGGNIALIMLFNRALSPSEIQQLYVEPYCFVAPQRNRFIIQMGAGEAPSGITYSSAKSMIYTY